MSEKTDKMLEEIDSLTVIELSELVKGIEQKREQRLKFIEKIMEDIRIQLKKQHIEAEVTGRAKHLYSIYRKMIRDNKTLD